MYKSRHHYRLKNYKLSHLTLKADCAFIIVAQKRARNE